MSDVDTVRFVAVNEILANIVCLALDEEGRKLLLDTPE